MSKRSKNTRRTFLKQAGAAGAGALALPMFLPSRLFGADAPSNKLNIALFACGDRANQNLPSLLGENIVALCDVDQKQIARIKETGAKAKGGAGESVAKAKVYEDYRKLLDAEKSVDAVMITAGQRWHVPMSIAALKAGKHVFCEKPLAHSCEQARDIRELAKKLKLATQVGSQGGASDTFRRSMEIVQGGLLGQIKEVHVWITRGFDPSASIDQNADPIPEGLNWDFWCGPSPLLPFKKYYLGGCLRWGRWLDFADGHLADMGAHGFNLPWRALKLGAPIKVTAEPAEPAKDAYPSANIFRWEFPARDKMNATTLIWHDGKNAAPPKEYDEQITATHGKKNDGVLFVGEKGLLYSNAWGAGGSIKLKDEAKFKGVLTHDAQTNLATSVIRLNGQNHMGEWLDACKGKGKTFQGFETAADVAEIAMTGIVALRMGKPIEWDSENLKAKGMPEADKWIHLEMRKKWL
ncbi:MAG: Gfo/Idh/MocA family oxidoreductase [Candidatus Sumerlaeota bacterium]|nr:Gfo/Idh/MocA family oxidoreductase [Candidatus Sumerlaeota bacterium]